MKIVALNTLADIKVGYQSRKKIEERADGTHRLIQAKDCLYPCRIQQESLTLFVPERKPESYQVHKNDILFQARGVEHIAYCIEDELENTLAASTFYILRLKTVKLLSGYLSWFLNQPQAQNYFKSQSAKSIISFVSKNVLSNLMINVPSIEVQQKIVNINRLWMQEKALREQLIEKRSQLIQIVNTQAIQK